MLAPTAVRKFVFGREVVGFVLVGGAATAIQVVLFNILIDYEQPLMANAASMVGSAIFAYIGNRYVAFGHRRAEDPGREIAAFVVVNALAVLIGEMVLASAYPIGIAHHDRFAMNLLNLVAVVAATAFRFHAYQRVVFAVGREQGAKRTTASCSKY